MADILIRGMEMPEYCYDCPCHNGESGYCQLYKDGYLSCIERPAKCPLVPLPEGHGRLIDADAPIRVACYDGTIHKTTASRLLCEHSLLDLPKTIVPAEGADE